jgi:hypothetical protein
MRAARCLPLLACAFGLGGCGIPLPMLHGPVPLPPATATIGFGSAPLVPSGRAEEEAVDQLLLSMLVTHRIGVDERIELGTGFGLYNGFSIDGKYLIVPGPLAVAGNVTVSTGFAAPVGIHPALLIGGERLYGGARLMTFAGSFRGVYPGAYAGASIGGRFRVVPEAAWLRDPEEDRKLWMLGVQVQRRLETDADASGFVSGWLEAVITIFELLRELFAS